MRYPAFVGPSYTSQSKLAAVERCVNLYPERIESPGAKVEWALYPTPGFSVACTLAHGPFRGGTHINGRTFVVGGAYLYELTIGEVATEVGSGLTNIDDTPVTFSCNGDGGNQLFITSCSKGYVYDLTTNTLSWVIDGTTQGAFIDGFFLGLSPQDSRLYISGLEDGATWTPSQNAQRIAGADKWAGLLANREEVWLFGSQTSEVYYNSGASPYPFEPNKSAGLIAIGIAAPMSAVIVDNAPMWLGQNRDGGAVVYRADGYAPKRVSTHAVEHALSSYTTLTDARGWSYQERGHTFYVLTLPLAGATWVWDAATGQWHERGDWSGSAFTASPIDGHFYAWGRHYTGDRTSGAIYRMSTDYTSDGGGRTLRRMRRAPHLYNENKRVIYDKFELHLETGLGLTTGQGSDPLVDLRWSDDGGQTWSNWHACGVGERGAYRARAIWRRLGIARDRVFEMAMSDPIPWRLMDAYVEARPGVM